MIHTISHLKYKISTTAMLLAPIMLSAQEPNGSGSAGPLTWVMNNIIIVMAILTIGAVFYTIWRTIDTMSSYQQRKYLEAQGIEMPVATPRPPIWKKAIGTLSGLKPLEKEADIQLDHDYDGIHELDNSLPPWWLYMFYGTIIWAGAYIYVFHLSDVGVDQATEFAMSMEEADKAKQAYLDKQANAVDESNVYAMVDESDLKKGQSIFIASCAACHGQEGQGGVGPNMTDDYWIHGGDIKDVFKTIKYGVPEKGMIAWKTQLPPSAMQQVASFIKTMRGTNPPNPKKPEGVLYVETEMSDEQAENAKSGGSK